MNAKEEIVEKIASLTADNEITWKSKNVEDFKSYFTAKNSIKRILVSEYKLKMFLVVEESKKYENLATIFSTTSKEMDKYEYSVYYLYIIENRAIQVSINEEEISKDIFDRFISEVVQKYSERYLKNLLSEF